MSAAPSESAGFKLPCPTDEFESYGRSLFTSEAHLPLSASTADFTAPLILEEEKYQSLAFRFVTFSLTFSRLVLAESV